MSFYLNSIITIGAYKFRGVHNVHIKKSIHTPANTCSIKLPITARLRQNTRLTTVSMRTAEVFNEGDKVTVELGYNGIYKQEFVGFIRRLNFGTPLEIECEGYIYQLRKRYLEPRSFKNVDYKEIIAYIIAGTDIVLSDSMKQNVTIKVEKFNVTNDTGAENLERLNKHLSNVLTMVFHANVLYVGGAFLDAKTATTATAGNVKYQMGWNVIKDAGLRLRTPPVDKVNIRFIAVKNDGTKSITNTSDSGNVKRIKSRTVTDAASTAYLAKLNELKETYTGYEGKITAFGFPFCEHGYVVQLTDTRYNERSGNYLCDSVEVKYNRQGFRRIVGIGIKL